jgi:peptidoglycan/LPS O-acetylase OafA/YrhL
VSLTPDGDRVRGPAATSLSYQPALDGLRGIAVATVLLYHAGVPWMIGGYLGVSTFFTLSGFLITSLLLAEHARTGRIHLAAFWERRFRRIMPAALAALCLALVFGAFAADAYQREHLRGDTFATLGYVVNWWFIVTRRDYADIFGSPSPVQHFWSLAIEEQFYLAFPLLTALVLRSTSGSRRALAGVLAVLAAASAACSSRGHRPTCRPRGSITGRTRAPPSCSPGHSSRSRSVVGRGSRGGEPSRW